MLERLLTIGVYGKSETEFSSNSVALALISSAISGKAVESEALSTPGGGNHVTPTRHLKNAATRNSPAGIDSFGP